MDPARRGEGSGAGADGSGGPAAGDSRSRGRAAFLRRHERAVRPDHGHRHLRPPHAPGRVDRRRLDQHGHRRGRRGRSERRERAAEHHPGVPDRHLHPHRPGRHRPRGEQPRPGPDGLPGSLRRPPLHDRPGHALRDDRIQTGPDPYDVHGDPGPAEGTGGEGHGHRGDHLHNRPAGNGGRLRLGPTDPALQRLQAPRVPRPVPPGEPVPQGGGGQRGTPVPGGGPRSVHRSGAAQQRGHDRHGRRPRGPPADPPPSPSRSPRRNGSYESPPRRPSRSSRARRTTPRSSTTACRRTAVTPSPRTTACRSWSPTPLAALLLAAWTVRRRDA
ncbi:hypothetical protein ACRAWF_13405 [Streptomyces sp. L7]